MGRIEIENLSFTYPGRAKPALDGVSLCVEEGEFVALCGASGCGKTTLLRLLKPGLAPRGALSGRVELDGVPLGALGVREAACAIGFVFQDPEAQIVTDRVWHELAFTLESVGERPEVIRRRVAEMAEFFGISEYFRADVATLSGGQKQLLALASVMAAQPRVLLLDEPTSRLDPVAAADFLSAVGRVGRELGTTVIIAEHRLDDVFPLCDRVLALDAGRAAALGAPCDMGQALSGTPLAWSLPDPMRVYASLPVGDCPVTPAQGRRWLTGIAGEKPLAPVAAQPPCPPGAAAASLRDVSYRYERSGADILRGVSFEAHRGEIAALMGGNGAGKSTLLRLLAGDMAPRFGRVEKAGRAALLPQDPRTLFAHPSVSKELEALCPDADRRAKTAALCSLETLLPYHPYDLSGGEQQRLALAMVLLGEPDILLLDEPTKGLDAYQKLRLGALLRDLALQGRAVVLVSHDADFCARFASRVVMLFDGSIAAEGAPREFFAGNCFYTTPAARMARGIVPGAVLAEDIMLAIGGSAPQPPTPERDAGGAEPPTPQAPPAPQKAGRRAPLSKGAVTAIALALAAIPLTIFLLGRLGLERKYLLISLLVAAEAMLPCAIAFEGRRPQPREIVLIAALCALGAAGRAAFFMLPDFKPVLALVVVAGMAFGGETGFLVGALTGFVSNLFFGQGAWTPWQMLAYGLCGLISGLLRALPKRRLPLCLFGALLALAVYGGIMNPASVLIYQAAPTISMLGAAYLTGLPMDLVHASATFIFLWLLGLPMLGKLERIREKYGALDFG